jgi:hypothetical protein
MAKSYDFFDRDWQFRQVAMGYFHLFSSIFAIDIRIDKFQSSVRNLV